MSIIERMGFKPIGRGNHFVTDGIGKPLPLLRGRWGRRPSKRIDATGIKRQFVPGTAEHIHTPYFAKERRRRRAANKVARRSRAVNAQRRKAA